MDASQTIMSHLRRCASSLQVKPRRSNQFPMQAVLPLDKMTKEEKLRAMEELWFDLSRDETQVASPTWHGEVLHDRAEAVKSGKEVFMDWEAAKKQLRNRQE
jgi:hypothetical protein